jgi:DNA-directed RNA polymerase subunit RPC12/RpoP
MRDDPYTMPELKGAACPRCGGEANREETSVGVMLRCPDCGFEAGDPLRLDFKSD